MIYNYFFDEWNRNNKERSHPQLDSRKQVIEFQDRVITINIKEAQHPLKWEKQVIDKSSIMLKISTKSMHRVPVWEIGPANFSFNFNFNFSFNFFFLVLILASFSHFKILTKFGYPDFSRNLQIDQFWSLLSFTVKLWKSIK